MASGVRTPLSPGPPSPTPAPTHSSQLGDNLIAANSLAQDSACRESRMTHAPWPRRALTPVGGRRCPARGLWEQWRHHQVRSDVTTKGRCRRAGTNQVFPLAHRENGCNCPLIAPLTRLIRGLGLLAGISIKRREEGWVRAPWRGDGRR